MLLVCAKFYTETGCQTWLSTTHGLYLFGKPFVQILQHCNQSKFVIGNEMYSFLLFFIQPNVNSLQQSVLKYVASFISCWCGVFKWNMLQLVDMCKCVKKVQSSSIPSS